VRGETALMGRLIPFEALHLFMVSGYPAEAASFFAEPELWL
jgi:hypothetical protein